MLFQNYTLTEPQLFLLQKDVEISLPPNIEFGTLYKAVETYSIDDIRMSYFSFRP